MTLIACIAPDTHPMLFADTLLSSAVGRSGVALPSVGQRHQLIKTANGLQVWGCQQKVVRIGKKIVAMWAGAFEPARTVLKGVERFFGEEPPSAFYLHAYIRANHGADLEHVSLIFSVLEKAGNVETLWFSCRKTIIPPLGQIIFGGTGADRFYRYANQNSMRLLRVGDYVRIGVASALQFTGCLLADEMATGAPLQDSFGGAYEIVSFWDGSSQKVDDCVYLFWFPEQQIEGGFSFHLQPRKIMRRYENNGMTAFYCLEAEPAAGFGAKVTKDEVFILKDFLGDTQDVKVSGELPSLNAAWQVNVFCARMLNGRHRIAAQINFRRDTTGHTVEFLPGKQRLQFDMAIDMEAIRSTVVQLLR